MATQFLNYDKQERAVMVIAKNATGVWKNVREATPEDKATLRYFGQRKVIRDNHGREIGCE